MLSLSAINELPRSPVGLTACNQMDDDLGNGSKITSIPPHFTDDVSGYEFTLLNQCHRSWAGIPSLRYQHQLCSRQ